MMRKVGLTLCLKTYHIQGPGCPDLVIQHKLDTLEARVELE